MPINFIPNDPRAAKFNTVRTQSAAPERPATSATLNFTNLPKQDRYKTGEPDWLAWQIRESAYRALDVFERIDAPLTQWPRSIVPGVLEVVPVLGNEANAYYDGQRLVFCQVSKNKRTYYTGASTDVVAHETGHAILDALRPDLWSSNYLEVAAFHEAFADCIALLTALSDVDIRRELAHADSLDRHNFVETWGEELAWLAGSGYAPRQALNTLTWHIPTANDEIHDFGQIFTGCFYDIIRLLFSESKNKSEKTLWNSTKKAARLLFSAVRKAQVTPRYFQAIGRVMEIDSATDARLHTAVKSAFAAHGFMLGSASILSPNSRLKGAVVTRSAHSWAPSKDALADLRSRTGADPSVQLGLRNVRLAGRELVEASYPRAVEIKGIGPAFLDGVQAIVPEGVLLGRIAAAISGPRGAVARREDGVAIMSAIPDPVAIENEVMEFVGSLIQRHQIAPATVQKQRFNAIASVGMRGADEETNADQATTTHQVVVAENGVRVIERLRFACQCRQHRPSSV